MKAALSCGSEDGVSYLGMRGHVQADRLALLQLLHLSLSSLDRLREKEIEVLKAATAAAAAAGQCAPLGEKFASRAGIGQHRPLLPLCHQDSNQIRPVFGKAATSKC